MRSSAPARAARRTPVLINKAIAKVFGTANDRAIKRLLPLVTQINELESSVQSLTDEQLRDKTGEFRQRVAAAIEGLDPKVDPEGVAAA